MLSCLCTGK